MKINKKRIFDIIQIGSKYDVPSRAFDIFISAVIILNIVVMFLETFDELSALRGALKVTEYVTILIFCAEYALRLWTAELLYPGKSRGRAVIKFMLSFDGIVDLLTILPFFFLDGFVIFRILRVVRIFHLFRLNAQYDSFGIIAKVLKAKKNQIFSSVFIIIILMCASSLGIYGAEHDAQPEAFRNAFSGIWWSMATLLTIGYGDIYPVTFAGKLLAIITGFLGVGAVAIPTGIISAGFVEHYTKEEHSDRRFVNIKEVGEVLVDDKSELKGLSPDELDSAFGIKLYMLIRGELTIVPTDNLRIQSGDILIIRTEKFVPDKKRRKRGKK